MLLKNSISLVNEFFSIAFQNIRKIYLNSNIYNKKISINESNSLNYKPSLSILSCLIKYEKKKNKIEDFNVDSIWEKTISNKDLKKLHSFYWLFSIDLKSSKKITHSIIKNWIKKNQNYSSVDEHPVARRRNQWVSPQEMFERFRQRHPFDLWREDILSDYCRYGVNKITNELFELACPPRTEATIYMGSAGMNIADFIAAISNPVTVMRAFRSDVERAEMDFAQSPTWPDLSNHFINGRDLYFPELTHFIPMQKPEVVSAEIVTALSI